MRRIATAFAALAALAIGSAAAGEPQAGGLRRIGVLLPGPPPSESQPLPVLEAFLRGLREHGYVAGKNIAIEYRFGEGREDRLPGLAAELVRLNVAVLVAGGTPAVQAARQATTSVPIVIASAGDPVGAGFVETLARPGGNVTGMSMFDTELSEKRLELLKYAVPGLTRVGALWSANDAGMTVAFAHVARAAQALGLQVHSMPVRESADIAPAFDDARRAEVGAMLVIAQPFTQIHLSQIVELAARHRLPAIYTLRPFVDRGGMMSYGPVMADLYRRAASHVDRILRGAKPADLPVEQPTAFELVVNLKAARALGLTIPESIFVRADEVIE